MWIFKKIAALFTAGIPAAWIFLIVGITTIFISTIAITAIIQEHRLKEVKEYIEHEICTIMLPGIISLCIFLCLKKTKVGLGFQI